MRRDVHDLDVRMAQELVELSEHVLDAEPLADSDRGLGPYVVDPDHALSVPLVAGRWPILTIPPQPTMPMPAR